MKKLAFILILGIIFLSGCGVDTLLFEPTPTNTNIPKLPIETAAPTITLTPTKNLTATVSTLLTQASEAQEQNTEK